jgi:hypothetical protein
MPHRTRSQNASATTGWTLTDGERAEVDAIARVEG